MNTRHTQVVNRPAAEVLRDAAEWRMIQLLFSRPVNDWSEEVASLAQEIRDVDLVAAARVSGTEASVGLFDTTFGSGGPAAPREVSYRICLDAGAFLSELSAFYTAFCFRPSPTEPPDHVNVETGFVGYLYLKKLYALQRADVDQQSVVADAIELFVRDHLAVFAGQLTRSLQHSGVEYLSLAASSLLRRVGPPPTREPLTFRSNPLPVLNEDDSDESSTTCGML